MASPEEAVCTHWKKRWPHRKKLFVPKGSNDGLTEKSYLYPLEEEMTSPEEALCTQGK
jgi:hypothetical protein